KILTLHTAPREAVQSASTQLWFAEGIQVKISIVSFQYLHNLQVQIQRFLKTRRLDKFQVIARCVVLRELGIEVACQTADWEVKARRAILSLVVAVRKELKYLVCGVMSF